MLTTKYNYIREGYVSPRGIGTPNFADFLVWANCLIEPMTIESKMTFLDYGCADARLANFLAAHIDSFKYYGLEHPKSELVKYSNESIFLKDPRCKFGLLGSEMEKEALKKSKYVVLGSVFTHLKIGDFHKMMAKFKDIVKKKNGEVVFSVFIKDKYEFESHSGVYGVPNCISRVFYTERQIEQFAKKNGYVLQEYESFLAQGSNLHRIFKISKPVKKRKNEKN